MATKRTARAARAAVQTATLHRIATVSRRHDPASRDVRLVGDALTDDAASSDWLTVRQHSWPGAWPPVAGTLVRLYPARVELAEVGS